MLGRNEELIYSFIYNDNGIKYRYFTKNKDIKIYPNTEKEIPIESITVLKSPIETSKPRSLIIRGSFEDFSLTNSVEGDLHVGITDSKNNIYNFWTNYLIEKGDNHQWKNLLVIKLDSKLTDEEWDSIMEKTTETNKIDFSKYTLAHSIETLDKKNDCYSYALRILNALEYNDKTNNDLIEIAVDLIEPKLKELKLFSLVWNNINEENDWIRIKI